MIRFENVSFAYGHRQALEQMTCEWREGQIVGLIGPNGSGKSTSLRLGAGLLAPQAGQVLWNDADLKTCSPKQIARGIGFLPQRQTVPGMTVRTLVEQGRYPYTGLAHRLGQQDREAVEEALELTGMAELAHRSLASLSGGQLQKAYLAMVMAQQTQHILLDEPMTYLDIGHQLEVAALLRKMANAGRSVVVVLHDLGQAMACCDVLQVVHRGRLIFTGEPEQLLVSGALETAFGVRPQWREGLHFTK